MSIGRYILAKSLPEIRKLNATSNSRGWETFTRCERKIRTRMRNSSQITHRRERVMSPLTFAWMAISTSRLRSRRSFKAAGGATAWRSERPTICPPRTEEDLAGANWVCGADIVGMRTSSEMGKSFIHGEPCRDGLYCCQVFFRYRAAWRPSLFQIKLTSEQPAVQGGLGESCDGAEPFPSRSESRYQCDVIVRRQRFLRFEVPPKNEGKSEFDNETWKIA